MVYNKHQMERKKKKGLSSKTDYYWKPHIVGIYSFYLFIH